MGTHEFNSVIVSTLAVVIKLLWIVFIISLAIGLLMLMKRYMLEEKRKPVRSDGKSGDGYACPCCGTTLKADFKFCPKCKASLNDVCSRCGKELQVGWNSCPWCGRERKQ